MLAKMLAKMLAYNKAFMTLSYLIF